MSKQSTILRKLIGTAGAIAQARPVITNGAVHIHRDGLTARFPVDLTGEPCTAPDGSVVLAIVDGAPVVDGTATLRDGSSVALPDADLDRPILIVPPLKSATVITDGAVVDAIVSVLSAVSRDDARTGLNGVYLGSRWAAATDGHRMHLAMCDGPERGGLIPRAIVAAMAADRAGFKRLAIIEPGCHDSGSVYIEHATWSATAAVYGEFPDVRQVVPGPATHTRHVALSVADLPNVKVPASTEPLLKMTTNGVAVAWSWSHDGRSASGQITATTHGDPLTFGVNQVYLRDAARFAAGQCGIASIGITDSLAPMSVCGDPGRLAIVMPMRLE